DPGDQQNAPLPGIRFQVCAEGDGVVIRDAEDLKAGMLRPIDQFPCIVRDEALALPRVEMEIGSQFHAALLSSRLASALTSRPLTAATMYCVPSHPSSDDSSRAVQRRSMRRERSGKNRSSGSKPKFEDADASCRKRARVRMRARRR